MEICFIKLRDRHGANHTGSTRQDSFALKMRLGKLPGKGNCTKP
jgi:hypothetical protein